MTFSDWLSVTNPMAALIPTTSRITAASASQPVRAEGTAAPARRPTGSVWNCPANRLQAERGCASESRLGPKRLSRAVASSADRPKAREVPRTSRTSAASPACHGYCPGGGTGTSAFAFFEGPRRGLGAAEGAGTRAIVSFAVSDGAQAGKARAASSKARAMSAGPLAELKSTSTFPVTALAETFRIPGRAPTWASRCKPGASRPRRPATRKRARPATRVWTGWTVPKALMNLHQTVTNRPHDGKQEGPSFPPSMLR